MKIKGKLLIWITATLFGTIAVISVVIIASTISSSKQDIEDYRHEQLSKYKNNLENYVDIVFETIKSEYEASRDMNSLISKYGTDLKRVIDISESIINRNITLYETGDMTLERAKSESMLEIKNIRYDQGTGYIWINDTTLPYPKMIMHPTAPSLDGQVLDDPKYNVAFGTNKNLFSAFVEVCNEDGEGFVDYLWPKPTKEGLTEDQPKLSYVRLIEEWDWIIGTGIYIDDAVLDAQENSKNVIRSMRYDLGTGYFWINDTTLPYPRMIMHPTAPSLDGQVLDNPKYNVAFGTNKNFFSAFVEVCNENGEGFVDYLWPKPTKDGLTEDQPKLSYVKLFPEWNWIIGTGIYIDEIDLAVQQKADTISKETGRLVIIIIIMSLVIFAIAFIVSYIFANTLSKPLVRIADSAGKIAEGDLEVETLQKVARDEIGTLNKAFVKMIKVLKYKEQVVSQMAGGDFSFDVGVASERDTLGKSLVQMTNSLNNLLGQINMSVDQINIGADQVSQASQSLSQGATESASSLEEISASVTQINSQSRQNAENATEANSLAKQSSENADKGNKQMAALSDAMEKINASSDQSKKIVKVIDEIAFQTNLLALKANVEAARAGKYGKGFAVVADEVRNLAVRSAVAVKETTEMVDDSIKNIETGNKAVEATAAQLESIMGGSSKVADFLEEIATASKEQAEAIDQITQGLEQIDQVTQSNTASAEESAAASEELASQSVQLKNMVAAFKLKDIGAAPVAQARQIEYQTPSKSDPLAHTSVQRTETGIKPVDPSAVIALDDEDFDRF